MSTSVTELGQEDAVLLGRARLGDVAAYEEIYRRHHAAVLAAARHLAGVGAAEDLVAEAFTRTFAALKSGGGPDRALRAYLVTAVRNIRTGVVRKDHRLTFSSDVAGYVVDEADPSAESGASNWERALVRQAFDALPVRDRIALWWTTVEGLPVDELAADWDCSAHAVRQQAYRAREALRVAYLTAHVPTPEESACRSVLPLLSRRARGNLDGSGYAGRKVARHLDRCEPCTSAGEEITAVADLIRPA